MDNGIGLGDLLAVMNSRDNDCLANQYVNFAIDSSFLKP